MASENDWVKKQLISVEGILETARLLEDHYPLNHPYIGFSHCKDCMIFHLARIEPRNIAFRVPIQKKRSI